MIVLDGTTDTIQAFMAGAAATTNPAFFISYADAGTAFTPDSVGGALNGTTDVSLVAGVADNKRLVKNLTICNTDTAEVVVTVQFNDNVNDRVLIDAVAIPTGKTLFYSAETGWVIQPTGTFNGDRLLAVVQFTASGTFTKADHTGITKVIVEMVGGGGAGGGADITGGSQHSAGGGGGSGEYARLEIAEASLAAGETVTIGAGGVGVAGANGGDGGDTSFGTHVDAHGGAGGTNAGPSGALASARSGDGGNGGTGGDIQVRGNPGTIGFRNLGPTAVGGGGGGSYFSGGGDMQITAGGVAGDPGEIGGGGGGAATDENQGTARAGGDGGPGYVLVHVYGQ